MLPLALGLVSVLMLLAFPITGAHSWLSHFRTDEVRRSVLSHTQLERTPQRATAEEVYNYPATFVRLVEDRDQAEPDCQTATIPPIRVNIFLTRLKLGPPQTGGQDPLVG
jgi:hypothetical protein